MADYQLALQKRTLTGKKLKSLREEGLIPSVVYGGKEPIMTASEYNPTEKVLRAAGYHSPIDLEIDGKKQLAIAKNVDVDATSRRIINVEFQAISADAVVEATAPIVIVNFEASDASKLHLAYLQVLEELDIKAKPSDLLSEISVDAADLKAAGDKLTLADIKLPAGVELVNKELTPETVIANIYDPAAEAAAREAADKKAAEEAASESTEEAAEAKAEAATEETAK